jgi:hypothetical protein
MAPVEWTVISGELAESVLSNLLYNEHTNAVRIRPSQGDLGIDVLVPLDAAGEPFDVYQIKKFASNLEDSEKRQIKNSFRRFLVGVGRYEMPAADWYLMMPLDPTKENYLAWFNAMPGEVVEEMFADRKLALTELEKRRITLWRNADGRSVEWKGAIYCDNLAARYRFVIDYYLHGAEQTIRDAVKDIASMLRTDRSLSDSSNADSVALVTPAEVFDHLMTLQRVLDTDPHYRYGISLDTTAPDVVADPDLVAATQLTQEDGQTVTVRVYQRFAEALNERPIKLDFQILTDHATFDRQAFDLWRKYGKALTAPAEVTADLPGGLGAPMSGGVAQVSIGTAGQTQDARFRIRRPDGTTSEPFPFSITMSEGTDGNSGHGSDHTGFLDFEVISDRETRIGTWDFKRKKLVGAEVVAALPSIEFMQELRAPNILEIAQKYGQFVTYAEIPPTEYVFPQGITEYLRALAIVQSATATPILIPDLTTVPVTNVEAATEAAALVSGQVVLSTWQSIRMGPDISLQPAGEEQEVDLANHYQFLRFQRLILNVGEQDLTLGTVSTTYLSARAEIDGGQVSAYPYRNNTMQKNFSPNPDAAAEYEGHVLTRVIGRIDDDATSHTDDGADGR